MGVLGRSRDQIGRGGFRPSCRLSLPAHGGHSSCHPMLRCSFPEADITTTMKTGRWSHCRMTMFWQLTIDFIKYILTQFIRKGPQDGKNGFHCNGGCRVYDSRLGRTASTRLHNRKSVGGGMSKRLKSAMPLAKAMGLKHAARTGLDRDDCIGEAYMALTAADRA